MRTLLAGLLIASATLLGACASEQGGDITGTTWRLVSIQTQTPSFSAIVPVEGQANYNVVLNEDGTFSAKADCNQLSGTYTIQGEGILTMTPGPMTLAECGPDSLSDKYIGALGQTSSFTIADDQLTITLLDDGTLTYRAAQA